MLRVSEGGGTKAERGGERDGRREGLRERDGRREGLRERDRTEKDRDRKTERKRGAMLRVSEGGGGDKSRERGRERWKEGGTEGER